MVNWFMISILLFTLLMINIYLDQLTKIKFKEENLPKNILFPLDENIELPDVKPGEEIPKNIYRCYSTMEAMKPFQTVFDLTEKRMPDYKQIFYDDVMIDDFIKNNFSERIYNAYNHINPDYGAARADFFRYLIIYLYGGIYLDIKSGPNREIDDVFEPKLYVSKGVSGIPHFPKQHVKKLFGLCDDWSFITNVWMGSEWQQYFIISNKGNPYLKKTIQQMVSNIEGGLKERNVYRKGNISVVAMTGPITYSLIIEKYKNIYPKDIFFSISGLGHRIDHSLIDYKKIMKDKHYSKIKNKDILV